MKTMLMFFLILLSYSASVEAPVPAPISEIREFVSNSSEIYETKCYAPEELHAPYLIYNTLREEGVGDYTAKIMTAQAAVESGWFKSKLTREHNNVFAIQHSSKRETLSKGPNGFAEGRKGYCSYNNIRDSAADAVLYFKYRDFPFEFDSIEAYCKYLKKRNYYESDERHYTKAVKSAYKRLWS